MGGWLAFLLAKLIPNKISAVVGIAAAPDFTEIGFWQSFTIAERKQLNEIGYVDVASEYDEPYRITKKLIEDGRKHLFFGKNKNYEFPVRLLQGTADSAVKIEVPMQILEETSSPDIRLTLIKGADHSFSSSRCLKAIFQSIEDLNAR